MDRLEPTDSTDDRRSPHSDSANSAGSDSEARIRLAPWKRNAPWLVPCLIGLLGLLFGNNVISRYGQSEAPGDGDNDPSLLGPNGEGRLHATYSFRQAPFVHPKIVGDLVGLLSDTGNQVVAIDLLDSQARNRYRGDISVASLNDPPVPSWPWVGALEGERPPRESPRRQAGHAYRYVGSTPSGLDILHLRSSAGGVALGNHLLFVRIEADYGVDYEVSAASSGGQQAVEPEFRQRELIHLVGRIQLGDRWFGTVEVVGNDVVARGRNVDERCDAGGASRMEAWEFRRFFRKECKDGEPDEPPPVRVYRAPERR